MKMLKISLCFLITLACCSCSHYIGHKVEPGGKLPEGGTGIPFQMSRQEYSLAIDPSPDDPTQAIYKLSKIEVPDREHRYTLALDPGILAEGNFELTLNANGGISNADSATTGQAIAIFNALIGTAAKFIKPTALADSSEALETYKVHIKNKCNSPANEKQACVIYDRIDEMEKIAEMKKQGSGKKVVLKNFHYLDQAEKDILTEIKKPLLAAHDNLKKTYTDKLSPLRESNSDSTIIKEIEHAVANFDKGELEKIKEKIETNIPRIDKESELKGLITEAQNYVTGSKSKLLAIAIAFADMKPDVWRARHLLYTEDKLKEQNQQLLLTPQSQNQTTPTERSCITPVPAVQIQCNIKNLKLKQRNLIGDALLFQRIDSIESFISEIRVTNTKTGGVRQFAVEEQIKARAELDSLNERLAALRTKIISANNDPEPTKITSSKNIPVKIVKQDFIDNINKEVSKEKRKEKLKGQHPYVLVLEQDNDNISTSPTNTNSNGGQK